MIRGELTNLRAVERSDARQLHEWFNDPDLVRFRGAPASIVSGAEIERRIEAWIDDERKLSRPACFMIESLDGEAVGVAILDHFEPAHAAVALSLLIADPLRWGVGNDVDVVTTLTDVCFDQWNLHRVDMRIEAFDERAVRLCRQCGFRLDATLRDASFFDGAYHDVLIHSLLSTDRGDEEQAR